jgi:hypothetical protein
VAVCSSLSPLWAPHKTPGISLRTGVGLLTVAHAPGLSAAVGDAILSLIRRHPNPARQSDRRPCGAE